MKLKKSWASFSTLSLPACLIEFCKVTLTFESAVQTLWCDHSNETSLPVLTHRAICFSKFHKMKFRNLVENCFWLNLAVKGLMLCLQKLQKIIVLYLLHNSPGAFCVWVNGTKHWLQYGIDLKQQYQHDIAPLKSTNNKPHYIAASSSSSALLTNCDFMDLMLLSILFLCPIRVIPMPFNFVSSSRITFWTLLIFAALKTSEYLSMLMNFSHSWTDRNCGTSGFSDLNENSK